MQNIGKLKTELRNPRTMDLDKLETVEMVEKIVVEEKDVITAVLSAKKEIAKAVDIYVETLEKGGRIIVTGSGCSGDYASTDIMELSATFCQKASGNRKTDRVMALHTQRGWYNGPENKEYNIRWSKEVNERDQSEDSLEQARKDLQLIKFDSKDLIIIISASGRSPAMVELAREAKKRKGKVVCVSMNKNTQVGKYSDIEIAAITGPPPLTGSGRTLAGTASKIIITTISTAAHAKAGYVYSNLMVNLNIKDYIDNSKFVDRGTRIVETISGASNSKAKEYLEKADWNIKIACVMLKKEVSIQIAKKLLKNTKYNLRDVIG